MTTGERLKIARKAKGLTGAEIGAIIGVTRAQVSNIEKAVSELTNANAIVLADKLGLRLEWLLTGNGEMINPDASETAPSVGARLLKAREHSGLSQKQVSELTDIPRSSISKLENDEIQNYTDLALFYFNRFNIPLEWILTGKGPMMEEIGDQLEGSKDGNKINQRILLLINTLEGGNKSAFAAKIGTSSGVIGDIIGGRLNNPSFGVLEKIATTYPFLNTYWLLTGEGDLYAGTEHVAPIKQGEESAWLKRSLDDKDRLISEQQNRILELKEMIELLKSK